MGTVLQGALIVTAADQYYADLRIVGEKITAIGEDVAQPGDEIISVPDCYLFPGGIDPHTHFDLPVGAIRTADDFASGTRAALMGGTTTIIDYATQFRCETLHRGLENWHRLASGQCYTDYGFHMAITDWNDTVAGEMRELALSQGVSSFKLYMAYKNVLQVDDSALLEAFQAAADLGGLICLHCENGDVIATLVKQALAAGRREPANHPLTRPAVIEAEAVERAIMLASLADAPLYVVHLTSRVALAALAKARLEGRKVYGETCPQYLLLDESLYNLPDFEGAKYVISPPLRGEQDRQALWHGLAGGILDTVATDHCSFHYHGHKDLGRHDFSNIPNGMGGVETRLPLLYTYGVAAGKISLSRFVALTSTHAAKLFGLYPRKGTIAIGSDADIVVWDPAWEGQISATTQSQSVDYSPFEGFRQQGRVKRVLLRGKTLVQDSVLIAGQPQGQYVPRRLGGHL